MKAGIFLKAGLGCAGLVVLGFIGLLGYVLYRQHAYKTMVDSHDLKQRIEKLGAEYLAKRPNAAVVVGIYQRGTNSVTGFGRVSAANSATPDGETIFEIGSVTKVFTAAALAQLVNEGQVKLEDPISRLLPKEATAPQKDGREICLVHLATHSSGLPRLPEDLLQSAKDELNPYVEYQPANLYQSLASLELKSAPGQKMFYSNFGYGLLGHLLELKTGKPYETLVREIVCAPLAMSNTVIELSAEQQERLSPGHDPKGNVVPNWDFAALAPAGAFRSTANDLLKFVEANLGNEPTAISRALTLAQERHYKEMAGGIGLAWQIVDPVEGQKWHWHNGGTGGYVSFVGFDRTNQVGVVLLSNYGDAMAGDNSLDRLGVELLRLAAKISLE
jgi:CubicO group peptidase (beta-lactamase class C family)